MNYFQKIFALVRERCHKSFGNLSKSVQERDRIRQEKIDRLEILIEQAEKNLDTLEAELRKEDE